jgi:hypothetical protein
LELVAIPNATLPGDAGRSIGDSSAPRFILGQKGASHLVIIPELGLIAAALPGLLNAALVKWDNSS